MDISAVESQNLSSALWHKSCKAVGFEDVLKTSPMKTLWMRISVLKMQLSSTSSYG